MARLPVRAGGSWPRLNHRASGVVDQVHIVETGAEVHARTFARAGVRAHPCTHVVSVDAKEDQRFHRRRLGAFLSPSMAAGGATPLALPSVRCSGRTPKVRPSRPT